MKLGLGTVQFGLSYGITNTEGQTPTAEAHACLAHAAAEAIPVIDTAALYGSAEEVLGKALPRPHSFRIITKTLALSPELPLQQALTTVSEGIHTSLAKLREPRLAGLLIHRIEDLLGTNGDALFRCLEGFKQAGLVEKIGVSLYTPAEARSVLARYPIDLIQLPLNPFDQRHLAQGSLAALALARVEIHVRSAFLQGLLLASSHTPPGSLEGLTIPLQRWHSFLEQQQLSPLAACLGFLQGIPEVDIAVCGATRLAEWKEIVAAHRNAPALPTEIFKNLAVADDKLIDPRYWPKR